MAVFHRAANVARAWGRGRVARSTSPSAAFRSSQVGAAASAGTAVVALFSCFLSPTEPLPLPTGEAAECKVQFTESILK